MQRVPGVMSRQKAAQTQALGRRDAVAMAMRATGGATAPVRETALAGTCRRAVAVVQAPVARSPGVMAAAAVGKGRARVATMPKVVIASAAQPSLIP